MDERADWKDLEDGGALVPKPAATAQESTTCPDGELARRLYQDELQRYGADVSSRKLGVDAEDEENGYEHAFEVAAFGWHYDETTDTIKQAPPSPPPPEPKVTCCACSDNVVRSQTVKGPCRHDYCNGCLEQLYTDCMKDETLFPPRYCQQIFQWEQISSHLTPHLRATFEVKRIELETTDRTYCCVPTCSTFIPTSGNPSMIASCPAEPSHGSTCTMCKQAWPGGHGPPDNACPRDEAKEALINTASRNEWQTCYGCKRLIELNTGCNHMTCVCKSEFCYVCGFQWKNCTCPQWDEDRLFERAEAVVDNGQMADNNQDREQQIAQAAEHLREHHECAHLRFRSINQRGAEYECELCGTEYRNWIYMWRQCFMFICNRCRHNRLSSSKTT